MSPLSLTRITAAAAALMAIMATTAPAQPHGHHGPAPAAPSAPAAAPAAADPAGMAEAEVRRIDAAAGRITLRHGPIANLDMPPMTMVFQVADPALLAGLVPGDKVRFSADRRQGAYVVTAIRKTP